MPSDNVNGTEFVSDSGDPSFAIVFPVCRNHVLRLGLESILSDTGFAVWHEIVDGFSRLPAVHHDLPALFIIDADSFTSGAIDLVRRLKAHAPTARIVLLADAFDPHTVPTVWDAGVHGFCLSSYGRDVFIKSIELVMLGEAVLPAAIVLPRGGMNAHDTRHEPANGPHHKKVDGPALSSREAEILAFLRDGAPNKVIARKLSLSEATVKVHVKTILKKVGVCNRTQAALWATRHTATDGRSL
ncbi:LuxR C-terminal-related transcriptional regulator [Microvirga calopogonii]|uniref:LuxR C-terminal-related transcriptional regulator n=1 Tax=Microvirga calopogonii TaxID=2078013 RepID=UPI000E0D73E9|nr:response regulator transcription factor [Microvirga calopogonii]